MISGAWALPNDLKANDSWEPEQKLGHYERLGRLKAGTVQAGQSVLLGLRGGGQEEDLLVLLRRDLQGNASVEEFKANIRGGWMQLRPGNYLVEPQPATSASAWRITNSFGAVGLPVWYDKDKDGSISDEERADSEKQLAENDEIFMGLAPVVGPALEAAEQERLRSRLGLSKARFVLVDLPQIKGAFNAMGLPELAPSGWSAQRRFNHYQRILVRSGLGSVASGRTYLLGLRGLSIEGARHDSGVNQGAYDDTYVVLKRDSQGNPVCQEFAGSTHAGRGDDPDAPSGGVAQIRPGHYFGKPDGYHHSSPCWSVLTLDGSGRIPCWRDADADGLISGEERNFSIAQNHHATYILLHNGLYTEICASIGCLTMEPAVFGNFCEFVGRTTPLQVAVVDANQPPVSTTTRYWMGSSVRKQQIYMYELGHGPRVALYFATIHGDEAAGTDMLERLRALFESQPKLLEGWTVRLIPNLNPDSAGRRRTNYNGVDLNRNFPAQWAPAAHGDEYPGPKALSEPESRALKAAVAGEAPGPFGRPERIIAIHQIRGLESGLGYLDGDGPAEQVTPLVDRLVRTSNGAFKAKKIADSQGRSVIPGSFGTWVTSLGIPTITYELSISDQGAAARDSNWERNRPLLLDFLKD